MRTPSFQKTTLQTLLGSLSLASAGLLVSASAVAQTVIPAISSGMSPARGSSITNVVIPPAAQSAGGGANAATLGGTAGTLGAPGAAGAFGNALQQNTTGADLGNTLDAADTTSTPDGTQPRGKTDTKTGKAPLKGDKSGAKNQAKTTGKADAAADAQGNANDSNDKSSKAAGDENTNSDTTDETASEAIKNARADETEFQRFVRNATGISLRLFGYELFAKASDFAPVQAAPVPAGYVLGPGDEIVVQVNGLVDASSSFLIDRDGRIMVPKAGPLSLAGVPLSDVERVLSAHLGKIYRNFKLSVTMGRLRSIEVFVLGNARKPGKHVVSSMSGLVNALLETGGPSSLGSMRTIELRRAGKTVSVIDLYAFLSLGDSSGDTRLLSGDIIYIPPAGPRAAVLGTINAPAIYELREGESIAKVLALSGGLPTLAAPQKAQLERVDANRDIARYVEDFALDAEGQKLALKAGDILTVFQISPQISNVVTLEGNVASPLRYTFRPGMRISDLLSDKRLLIPGSYWSQINRGTTSGSYSRPEVNTDYATVQRLNPKLLRTEILAFDLSKAMGLDAAENLELQSGDIVKVYRPNELGPITENSITVTGESIGGAHRFVWREGHTVSNIADRITELFAQTSRTRAASSTKETEEDNIYSSFEINLGYATVLRRDPGSLRSTLIAFNLGKALAGDPVEALELKSRDSIAIYAPKQLGLDTLNAITITGEIVGGTKRFVWREGFTIKDIIPSTQWLVDYYSYWQRGSARSLSNDINWDYAQVIRRVPATLQTKAITFNLGRAVLEGRAEDNIRLEPGDQIALFTTAQLPVPVEKRAQLVTLSGEVMIPGKYQVEPGETLPGLVKRAGGLSKNAYAYGTVFTRESTRAQQQVNLNKSVRTMENAINSQTAGALQNITDTEKGSNTQAQIEGQKLLLKRMEGLKASGRVALDLDTERPTLPPIVLEDGDTILVPNKPSFVAVFGEVFSESSTIHKPGFRVSDYLDKAGLTRDADTDNIMLVRADGTVENSANRSSFLSAGIQGKRLNPGDSIFVPSIIDRRTAYSTFIQGAKDWTAILYQFALAAVGVKTLRN